MVPYRSCSGVRLPPVAGVAEFARNVRADFSHGERTPYALAPGPSSAALAIRRVCTATPAPTLNERNTRRSIFLPAVIPSPHFLPQTGSCHAQLSGQNEKSFSRLTTALRPTTVRRGEFRAADPELTLGSTGEAGDHLDRCPAGFGRQVHDHLRLLLNQTFMDAVVQGTAPGCNPDTDRPSVE